MVATLTVLHALIIQHISNRILHMSDNFPIVSIVGRQNVGKSTLFNALVRDRKAIVDAFPGLTRDILSYHVVHKSSTFALCDTPGLDLGETDELSQSILEIAHEQLRRSSLILLLLENPAPAPFDLELISFLRKLSVPVITAINKMDNSSDIANMGNFYETGFNDIIPISALRKKNLPLLLDKIVDLFPASTRRAPQSDIRIAIAGRPNSGKSTLLNNLIGYNRAVVSDIPGTTRDSIDEEFNFQGKRVRIIDTAGLKKKGRLANSVEFYSHTRTIESISRSDIVIHLLDATLGLTETDKKISGEIMKARKTAVIAINKWDAIEKSTKTFDEFKDKIIFKFYKAADYPILSIAAKDKLRIHKLIETAIETYERSLLKVDTPSLNKMLERIQHSNRLPLLGDKLKIFYGTQTGSAPPRFKLFVNNAELFRKDDIRYLEKALKKELALEGIPVAIDIEGRKHEKKSYKKR